MSLLKTELIHHRSPARRGRSDGACGAADGVPAAAVAARNAGIGERGSYFAVRSGSIRRPISIARSRSWIGRSRARRWCSRWPRMRAYPERRSPAWKSQAESHPDWAGKVYTHYDGQRHLYAGRFATRWRSITSAVCAKPLPISAEGETALHRSLGFDHRGRVDVAVNPDQPEGEWLMRYLESKRIPYFAFRAAVPHQGDGRAHPRRTRKARSSRSRISLSVSTHQRTAQLQEAVQSAPVHGSGVIRDHSRSPRAVPSAISPKAI